MSSLIPTLLRGTASVYTLLAVTCGLAFLYRISSSSPPSSAMAEDAPPSGSTNGAATGPPPPAPPSRGLPPSSAGSAPLSTTAPAARRREDSEPVRRLKFLVPKLPLLARVALVRAAGLSEAGRVGLDLYSELTVAVVRSYTVPARPRPISQVQGLVNRPAAVRGKVWISRAATPVPPEDDVRAALGEAVEALRDKNNGAAPLAMPQLAPVHAEWTGYRADATATSRLPRFGPDHTSSSSSGGGGASSSTTTTGGRRRSHPPPPPSSRLPRPAPQSAEQQDTARQRSLYGSLMGEVTAPTTVLYFHGGAHYLMDPSTHRHVTKTLAKLTGGRCYSVRYRLAPQHPFPAGLLDALVAYLTLLYPPEGAFHEPVRPEHLVLAGDSAGGNLCFALVQTLLTLRRNHRSQILWFGQHRALPLPAGVACASPWVDISQSSPSWGHPSSASSRASTPALLSARRATAFDYLPARPTPSDPADLLFRRLPACDAWRADDPPRATLYADDAWVAHPLVSPVAAADWSGCPPVWISVGWERLADEILYLAAKLAKDQSRDEPAAEAETTPTPLTTTTTVPVVRLEQYDAMPHAFSLVLKRTGRAAWRCNGQWAGFVRACVEDPSSLRRPRHPRPHRAGSAAAATDWASENPPPPPPVAADFVQYRPGSLAESPLDVDAPDEDEMRARMRGRVHELVGGLAKLRQVRAAAKL